MTNKTITRKALKISRLLPSTIFEPTLSKLELNWFTPYLHLIIHTRVGFNYSVAILLTYELNIKNSVIQVNAILCFIYSKFHSIKVRKNIQQ